MTPWTESILQARILEWVAMPSSMGSSQPRDQPRSPTLQVDSLPSEPPGKPKNTGVGSLSLLQGYPPDSESETGVSCITGRFSTSGATREVELPQIWKKLWFSQEVVMTTHWEFSDFSLISWFCVKTDKFNNVFSRICSGLPPNFGVLLFSVTCWCHRWLFFYTPDLHYHPSSH